jgi:hypothetical protein
VSNTEQMMLEALDMISMGVSCFAAIVMTVVPIMIYCEVLRIRKHLEYQSRKYKP